MTFILTQSKKLCWGLGFSVLKIMIWVCVSMQEEADKQEERELTPDEMGRKIASQWMTDPDAAGTGDLIRC